VPHCNISSKYCWKSHRTRAENIFLHFFKKFIVSKEILKKKKKKEKKKLYILISSPLYILAFVLFCTSGRFDNTAIFTIHVEFTKTPTWTKIKMSQQTLR
jgi:hypothetical protein